MTVDQEALKRSVDAIVHDILKLPGQAGLGEKEKWALTMETLTIVAAEVIFVQSEGWAGDKALMDTFTKRLTKQIGILREEYDRRRGRSPVLDIIREMLMEAVLHKPNAEAEAVACPHCGTGARYSVGDQTGLQPGKDATLCFECGNVGIIDLALKGGARKATEAEEQLINADPMIQITRKLWEARQQKSKGAKS